MEIGINSMICSEMPDMPYANSAFDYRNPLEVMATIILNLPRMLLDTNVNHATQQSYHELFKVEKKLWNYFVIVVLTNYENSIIRFI